MTIRSIPHDYTTKLLISTFTRWLIPSVAAYRVSYPEDRFHAFRDFHFTYRVFAWYKVLRQFRLVKPD